MTILERTGVASAFDRCHHAPLALAAAEERQLDRQADRLFGQAAMEVVDARHGEVPMPTTRSRATRPACAAGLSGSTLVINTAPGAAR